MKTVILNLSFFLGCLMPAFGQQKSTIAVTNPSVNGLYATPTIAAKLIRLELTKIEQYNVFDEFDMADIYLKDSSYQNNCVSTSCLIKIGNELNVDYVVSGSFDAFGNKIIINLKLIDVKNEAVLKTGVREFDNQESELQRMTGILIREMHGLENEPELVDRLEFKNEMITSNNVGRINNSGPRVGFAMLTGSFSEFATRPTTQGGLDIFPGMSLIGYQIEGQYVGTENFSGLVEGIINVAGLEQGVFLPSISILNGFRFGRSGWEFAFGPSFGIKRVSNGFFDTEGLLGKEDQYYSHNDWFQYVENELKDESTHPEYFENGVFTAPSPSDIHESYNLDHEHGDTRGLTKLNTSFIIGAGRTFHAGALNIPVNIFYSSKKGGGMLGLSVGFNVVSKKKPINSEI